MRVFVAGCLCEGLIAAAVDIRNGVGVDLEGVGGWMVDG